MIKISYRAIPYIRIGDKGQDIYVYEIQARAWIFWHTVAIVEDEDDEYVYNRASEIIDILENPNR